MSYATGDTIAHTYLEPMFIGLLNDFLGFCITGFIVSRMLCGVVSSKRGRMRHFTGNGGYNGLNLKRGGGILT